MIKVCNLEAQYIPHSICLFIFPCRQMLGMFKVQVLRLSFKIINRSLRVPLKIQIKDEEEQIYYCLIVNIDGEERNSNKNSQLWWSLWMNYVTPLAKIQFSSVAQSCPTLQPHGRQISLSITNSRSWLKLMSIELVMPSSHLILCWPFSSCLQSFPASGSFPVSQFFSSDGQIIGASASASALPMNTQDWTGCISLQSKWVSRVFSNTTVQKHQLFVTQLSLWSNSHIHPWPMDKP